jgi:hypothetical protein
MRKALNGLGYPVSHNKGRQWMREAGVAVCDRKKGHVMTNSNHKQPVFANCPRRQFSVSQLHQVYAADVRMGGPRKAGYPWPLLSTSIPGKSWAGA